LDWAKIGDFLEIKIMPTHYQPSSLKFACDDTHKQINRILMKFRIYTIAIPVDTGGTPNQVTESIRALPSHGILPPSAVTVL